MKSSISITQATALCLFLLLGSSMQASAQEASPPSTTPATPEAPTPAATFSDVELEQYVRAALAVQQIQQDSATPDADKQTKMAAAVQQAGLTPEKFNEIAAASQSDPALQQRLQAIAGKLQGATPPQQ
ncbi:DUF4168 domain-containing protein [Sphingobium ummariense]